MALLDDLIVFGQALRAKLHDWAIKLHTQDNPDMVGDDKLLSVLLWVKSLVMISWDVSESVFILARGDNARAMKILNRCLFEYWVRIYYYNLYRDDAVVHAELVNPTNRKGIRATRHGFDRSVMTAEEIAFLDDVLASNDEKIPNSIFRNMLRAVLLRMDMGADDKDAHEKWMYDNYYAIASGFVHGSPGLILDMYLYPDEKTVGMMDKSDRMHPIEGVAEAIYHLLWTLRALSEAIGHDEWSMWFRDYQLRFEDAIAAEVKLLDAERTRRRALEAARE